MICEATLLESKCLANRSRASDRPGSRKTGADLPRGAADSHAHLGRARRRSIVASGYVHVRWAGRDRVARNGDPDSMSELATYTIGHWTNREAITGCTAIIFDRLVPAAFEARGGAPGTRETDLLRTSASVRSVDAILLSGGSAPGLSAADGVIRYLQEHQRGFPTVAGPVPIVPAAIIFDLAVGSPVSPRPDDGYAACLAAVEPDSIERGQVGAGVGARIGTIHPGQEPSRGGFGAASVRCAAGTVAAYMVVNAAGEVVTPDTYDDLRTSLLNFRVPGEGPRIDDDWCGRDGCAGRPSDTGADDDSGPRWHGDE